MRLPPSAIEIDPAHAPPEQSGLVTGRQAARSLWVLLPVAIGLLGPAYADSTEVLLETWLTDDNYGHGPFIVLTSICLAWLRRDRLQAAEHRGSWWGLAILAGGLGVYVIGEFAAMHAVVHLSLWIVAVGWLACAFGLTRVRLLAFPLLYVLAAIPPPEFLQGELSSRLQVWSSALGVGCLQLIGVVAYREGSVIDLGPIQLQVVEACSGLRYLFPLTALAVLCAYLYREALWKRLALVLSSIPIAVLLNGFRIGMIGVLVEAYGQQPAEDFSHFFEGWVFFVASLGLLAAEMMLLARMGSGSARRSFRDLIGLPPVGGQGAAPACRAPAGPVLAGTALLGLFALAAPALASADLPVPARQSLLDFPLELGDWRGTSAAMERQYLDALQLDDYVLADYVTAGEPPVNLYIAYYASPKKGRSSHSPRQCIPGGGWEMTSFDPLRLDLGPGAGRAPVVNRAVIRKNGHRQIVYYWFKQRDRWLTSEYAVKFFLFWDALTRRRADGALIRLVSEVRPGEPEAKVDDRLRRIAAHVLPVLARYVPD